MPAIYGNTASTPPELRLAFRYRLGFVTCAILLVLLFFFLNRMVPSVDRPTLLTRFHLVICANGAFLLAVMANRRIFWLTMSLAWSVLTCLNIFLIAYAFDVRAVSSSTVLPYLGVGISVVFAFLISFAGFRNRAAGVAQRW